MECNSKGVKNPVRDWRRSRKSAFSTCRRRDLASGEILRAQVRYGQLFRYWRNSG